MKAIVVLGADVERMKKRFNAALSLYLQDQKDSVIIISGYNWEDEEIKNYISSKHEQHDIKIEDEYKSGSTKENAIYSLNKMEELGIGKADIVSGSIQAPVAKKYFKKNNKRGYKLNFYAATEGLKTCLEQFPWEVAKYIDSFLPEFADVFIRKKVFGKFFR